MRAINNKLHHLPQKIDVSDSDTKAKVKGALQNNNVFLLGDLNFHFPGENKLLGKHQFVDLWLERHSHFDGITWDTSANSMSGCMLPFDNRRMRLDRIAMRPSKQIDLLDIKMVGTENAGRACLYPSDHFGLMASFSKNSNGLYQMNNRHKKEFLTIPKDVTGYRSVELIITYRCVTIASIVLVLILGFYMLFF